MSKSKAVEAAEGAKITTDEERDEALRFVSALIGKITEYCFTAAGKSDLRSHLAVELVCAADRLRHAADRLQGDLAFDSAAEEHAERRRVSHLKGLS